MHVILWEFEPRVGREVEFEQAYGSNGAWGRLFARSAEYRGSELFRSVAGRSYLTIDRWTSAEAFAGFQQEWRKEYEAMDRRCEALTQREALLGCFDIP